jgi:hypothetical protein
LPMGNIYSLNSFCQLMGNIDYLCQCTQQIKECKTQIWFCVSRSR